MGQNGSPGVPGDQGEQGPQGEIGDIACGDDLIHADEWHSVCGSNIGECQVGQVQCRLYVEEGELLPKKVCYGEVVPAKNSGVCYRDADCDAVMDNTVGEGDNVAYTKQANQHECSLSGSSWSCDCTLEEGRCRNALKHCVVEGGLLGSENHEDVLEEDFVAAVREASMGFECVDSNNDVRTWECTMSGAVAVVTCTGPAGL